MGAGRGSIIGEGLGAPRLPRLANFMAVWVMESTARRRSPGMAPAPSLRHGRAGVALQVQQVGLIAAKP
jgi:hypothetical protein